jgi:2,4-dienoyl-CoA reductase-like NADH-dependent reductase (Old Yellow Enzyme family)
VHITIVGGGPAGLLFARLIRRADLADRLRHEASVPTMVIRRRFSPDEVNTILVAGRADLCGVLGRPEWTPSRLPAPAHAGHIE